MRVEEINEMEMRKVDSEAEAEREGNSVHGDDEADADVEECGASIVEDGGVGHAYAVAYIVSRG